MRFLPSHALVSAPDVEPSHWMLVLHGILGSGANFRTFARRLAAAAPSWGFVLVDLRMHGQSQGAPPPHTVESAADDLVHLYDALALPVAGVMGHSFGGKVALAFAARAPAPLAQAWVLDASPGARRDRGSATAKVVQTLRAIPEPLPSRERFVELVVADGHSRVIAEWLAMNVRRADDGFRLRLDLDAVQALLDSYFASDMWWVLDGGDPQTPATGVLERAEGARAFHVVVAGQSDAFDAADRARLDALAARSPRVHVHRIEHAGHWVHVDAPDALFDLVRSALR